MIGPKTPAPTPAEEAAAYELVTLRDANRCQRCLKNCGPIARDHRQNRSQGGRTVPENLQCLGLACHTWKTDNGKAAEAEGWGVPGWADPATYPARRWVHEPRLNLYRLVWVLYTRDGWEQISDVEAERRIAQGVLYEAAI